jgi:hypothetical protein
MEGNDLQKHPFASTNWGTAKKNLLVQVVNTLPVCVLI